jgi:hypothetical protein
MELKCNTWKNAHFFSFPTYHKNFKKINGKKYNLYCFSHDHKKWSVVRGKNSVVIEFHKNRKFELKYNTWKKDIFYFLTKPSKLKMSFAWKKTKFVWFLTKPQKISLIYGNNVVVTDFRKNKKTKLKCNTWKKAIS